MRDSKTNKWMAGTAAARMSDVCRAMPMHGEPANDEKMELLITRTECLLEDIMWYAGFHSWEITAQMEKVDRDKEANRRKYE